MLYNLPNGKTIYLTIEQYLNLTDEDIQYLISIEAGTTVSLSSFKHSELDSEFFPDDLKDDEINHNNLNINDDDVYYEDLDFLDSSDTE
jgi:hypothetical protein